jgi:signal transduction histidine kinase
MFVFRAVVFFIEGLVISFLLESRNKGEQEREKLLINEKIARRYAEQQARIRDHFIFVASHELKSPITSQKAYIQLLKRSFEKKKSSQEFGYLTKLEAQTDKLTSFVNDLLDVSKMSSRKLQYNFAPFIMQECVEEAIDSMRNLLATHKVILKGVSNRELYGDKDRVYQVLTNLLSNAIKYSPDGSRIIMSLSENRKGVTVSVKDFGIGIKDDHQKKIFNRFFRVSGNDESYFKGLGLGLYLSSQIIKKHKGKIWVESKEGKGSTFYFTIPFRRQSKIHSN